MSPAEVAAFEADPRGPTLLRMRTWDEAAKVPGAAVPSLEAYVPAMRGLLRGAGGVVA